MRRQLLRIALLLALYATEAAAEQARQEKVVELYQRGLQGDAGAVVECITLLEDVLRDEPQNQLARVTLGSTYTLRSRDLGLGPRKLSILRKGLKLMDDAVAARPADAKIRLIRARTWHALPGFFGKKKEAQQSFFALANEVARNPSLLPAEDRQSIFLEAGRAAMANKDAEKARRFWQEGLALAADTHLTAQLEAALHTHGR